MIESCLLSIVVILFIYVCSFVYFNINNRKISARRYDEEIRRADETKAWNEKQGNWENELRAMSMKVLEFQTAVKEWQQAYFDIKAKYDALTSENPESENTNEFVPDENTNENE